MDPSSPSSSMSRRNYDVFLSFRGVDTRHTIISHLYYTLCQKGVFTFKDNEELEAGDRRSEIFHAIDGSRVAVIMFSENYARSKWCLDELQTIMERKEQGKLTVLPIFYRVSPGEVRLHEKDNGEKGCYQIAMEDMEENYGKDSETVKRWRRALWEGGDLIGITLGQGEDEGKVVREVVEKLLKTLNRVFLEVAKYPVGIYRHLEAIRPLLHIDPPVNDVCMIGLLGQGGAGKTTLSKAIYNDIADRFDSLCFLPNVRETTSRVFNGLAHLQQKLLRELLSDKDFTVPSVDMGKQFIKERLCKKRVLIILDDVDELNQFDALAGNLNWFGNGSRIIVTTRNNHVLTTDRVEHVYPIALLNKEVALNLFRLHAFGENWDTVNIDRALIDSFIEYAGGLPLALVVLGAFLNGRSASEWKGKLKELNESSDETITSILKISFDGLENNQKEMFLDVACFFKGWVINDVEKILDSCGFATSLGIAILVDRCLITIDHGKIQMHDLLEAMGQNIVRGDYLRGNGIPSRIWLYKAFLDILSEDRERQQVVKGIVLNFSEREKVFFIESIAFMNFKKLRILIVQNVAGGPKKKLRLPRELRWLQWRECPARTIEFDSYNKLVGLDLEGSETRQIKVEMGYKERKYLNVSDCFGKSGTGFEELKYLNLSVCLSLVTLPDLSKSWKLEDLNLYRCENLTTLDEAVGSLENLVHLNLESCFKLVKVPSSLRSKHLQTLDYSWCTKLYKLPAIKEELTFLEKIDLSYTTVKELPDSIGNLVAIKELILYCCEKLTAIPSSIYKLRALEKLDLDSCKKFSRFPRRSAGAEADILGFPNLVSFRISDCKLKDLEFLYDLTCFKTLVELDLSDNEFDYVPACLSKFKNLEKLLIRGCEQVIEVSELPNVSRILADECRRLKEFPSLHTFICQSPKWFKVDLSNCLGLDHAYIDRSLPLEKVRGFVGAADVIYPGEELPHWVNFQTIDCDSLYLVYFPWGIAVNDLLGLAFFVSFDLATSRPEYIRIRSFAGLTVKVEVGGWDLWLDWKHAVDGVHTWFMYIPCDFPSELDWNKLYLRFAWAESWFHGSPLKRFGLRLLCKREQDEQWIQIHKYEDNESDSAFECV